MIVSKPTPEELDTFLKGLSDNELLELIMTRAHHDNTVPIEFVSKSTGARCGIDNEGYRLALKEKADRSNEFFKELEVSINNHLLIDKDTIGPFTELNRLADTAVEKPFSKRIVQREDDEVNPLSLLRDHDEVTFGGRVTDKPWLLKTTYPVVLGLGIDFPLTVVQEDQFSAREHARRLSSSPSRQLSSAERFEKFVKEVPIHELLELGDLIVGNPVAHGLGGYHSLTLDQSETVYHTDLPLIYGEIKSRFKQMGVVK